MTLIRGGPFYPAFTADTERYFAADRQCIERVVSNLLVNQTTGERPGMLLGKIQSGKTKTFLAVIALAFDNGYDTAIILTKGTKALTRQTVARVRREFAAFQQRDQLQIHDIMSIPDGLTGYELDQKLIVVEMCIRDSLCNRQCQSRQWHIPAHQLE